jgi:hypothetical protein
MSEDPVEENSEQVSDDDIIQLRFARNLFFGAVLFLGIGILLVIVTVVNHLILDRVIPLWEIVVGSAVAGALVTLLVLSTTEKK